MNGRCRAWGLVRLAKRKTIVLRFVLLVRSVSQGEFKGLVYLQKTLYSYISISQLLYKVYPTGLPLWFSHGDQLVKQVSRWLQSIGMSKKMARVIQELQFWI